MSGLRLERWKCIPSSFTTCSHQQSLNVLSFEPDRAWYIPFFASVILWCLWSLCILIWQEWSQTQLLLVFLLYLISGSFWIRSSCLNIFGCQHICLVWTCFKRRFVSIKMVQGSCFLWSFNMTGLFKKKRKKNCLELVAGWRVSRL